MFNSGVRITVISLCLCPLISFSANAEIKDITTTSKPADVDAQSQATISVSLEPISVLETLEYRDLRFRSGRREMCGYSKEPSVSKYPAFKSEKPLYGSVRLAGQSYSRDSGFQYYFAIDESGGTGKGYDELYFDCNCDKNLTNDGKHYMLANPPAGLLLENSNLKQQTCFENLEVQIDSGAGVIAVELMPILRVFDNEYASMNFVCTELRRGEIRLGEQDFIVFLGDSYLITGCFDRPWTCLYLLPKENFHYVPYWWGNDQLGAMHEIGGNLYHFRATPNGDRLFARPYEGPFGVFRAKVGRHKGTIMGSLRSENASVAVGNVKGASLEKTESCELPTGDYLPSMLHIESSRMRIEVSENYHSDGKSRDRCGRENVYGIKIRPDKPFVLNFAKDPEVIFASPSKDQRIKLGSELIVKAVLVDPELDIMLRGIRYLGANVTEDLSSVDRSLILGLSMFAAMGILAVTVKALHRYKRVLLIGCVVGLAAILTGKTIMCNVIEQLEPTSAKFIKVVPTVKVLRSDGTVVTEGAMPFG